MTAPPIASPRYRPRNSVSRSMQVRSLPPVATTTSNRAIGGAAPRYSPEELEQEYGDRPLLVGIRILTVVMPFVMLFLRSQWDRLWGVEKQRRPKYAVRLLEILTDLGPAYIKIGQALSTRPDLVSPVFLEELTKLQDSLPSFSNEIAFATIREELGFLPDEIYQDLTPDPIAAASLGQVYRGYLKTGEKVAVKVQRPDLRDRISIDMFIVRGLARWAQNNVSRVKSDLVGIADEFATKLFEEMDYTQEGRNAERFQQLYKHPAIYVPSIYWKFTSQRVLTMEWIDGIKLTEVERIEAAGMDGRELIEIGVNCSLKQLLDDGFFHADPHPGNLLAMADGRLAYLDFGMMSSILPHQRYGLINAIVHLVNRDFAGLARDYVQLGFLTEDTDLTPIIPALGQVFNSALGASVSELNFKSITDQLSEVMYEYPFRVPAYYALIIRSLLTLEGIAINIDPDFKVLSVAYPYIANRLLTDPAPELRESLQDLLFKDGDFRWNRLENLLRNAGNSEDYDLENALDGAVDFLLSDRGAFIRDRAIDVIFSTSSGSSSLENMQRVFEIVGGNTNFQPLKLLPVLGKVATHPEAQKLGQQLASRLLQRFVARSIRQLLGSESNGRATNTKALPPARPSVRSGAIASSHSTTSRRMMN
ncbi:MAG: AarF/ABC1/UbiB kinase family protein [Cyanobacteria bacterium J06639_1]